MEDENFEDVDFHEVMNSFEFAIILGVLMIIAIVGCCIL